MQILGIKHPTCKGDTPRREINGMKKYREDSASAYVHICPVRTANRQHTANSTLAGFRYKVNIGYRAVNPVYKHLHPLDCFRPAKVHVWIGHVDDFKMVSICRTRYHATLETRCDHTACNAQCPPFNKIPSCDFFIISSNKNQDLTLVHADKQKNISLFLNTILQLLANTTDSVKLALP